MVAVPVGRRPGRFGRAQVVAVELALIAVAAAVLAGHPLAMAAAGVAAVLLLAVVCGRSKGRWTYEAVGARRRLRQRRRAAARALRRPSLDPDHAGTTGGLAALAPGLAITAVTDRGTAIGVGQDDLGWFAAVAVAPWRNLSGDRRETLPLDRLAGLLGGTAVPASLLQVVTHLVPAPSAGVDAGTACAQSYRELAGGGPAAADQQVWVAVRLVPRDGAPAAASRGGGLAGVHRALAASLARVGTVLAAAGVEHQVLDADGLRQAVTVACGLQRLAGGAGAYVAPPSGGPPAVAESWQAWQAAGAAHVSFAVAGWPAPPPPGLLATLSHVPYATAVDSAVALWTGDGPAAAPPGDGPAAGRAGSAGDAALPVRSIVRVVAPPDRVAACVDHLLATAARLGVRLTRLDGEQATAVYATAPTGLALGVSPW